MTDEQIVKALELCTTIKTSEACDECPFKRKCRDDSDILEKEALNLINRQKAEIERLNAMHKEMCVGMKVLKRNAIKEFAERLKAIFNSGIRVYDRRCSVDGVVHNIDNLLKEMDERINEK